MKTWEDYVDQGLAREVCEPECENYFDVFGEPDTKEERAEICRMLDRDGCWWYSFEVRAQTSDAWESGASLGMVVGDLVSDEREDSQSEALAHLDKLFAALAADMASRATYAAV